MHPPSRIDTNYTLAAGNHVQSLSIFFIFKPWQIIYLAIPFYKSLVVYIP